jgi:hypothetical protein
MGRNVRSPGPGQDSLNKLFPSQLNYVAPPPNQEYFTLWTPALLESSSSSDGAVAVSNSASAGKSSTGGFDLEHVGGTIETWVRKMASSASKALKDPSTSSTRSAPSQGARTEIGGFGDLIELQDDPFEIGDGESRTQEQERGRSSLISNGSTGREDMFKNMKARDKGKSRKDD